MITATTDGQVFEVFAKIKPEDPLRHVGSVVATDTELAAMYAQTLYNEWNWNEMVIAPRAQILVLTAPD